MLKVALRKSWLRATWFYDKFFALGQGGLRAVRALLGGTVTSRAYPKPLKKRPYQPRVEQLEVREVPAAYTWVGGRQRQSLDHVGELVQQHRSRNQR